MLELFLYVAIGVIGAVVVFIMVILPKKRLERHDPNKEWAPTNKRGVELGMEETDMDLVSKVEAKNRELTRKNSKSRSRSVNRFRGSLGK